MYSRVSNLSLFSPIPLDVFYFPHYRARAKMAGPTCYYHAYRHLLDIQDVHQVPAYIEKMMGKIDRAENGEETNRIIYQTITERADELLWMADEVDQLNHGDQFDDLSDESAMHLSQDSSSEESDWAQDFIDHHGFENSIARLLQLQLSQIDINEFTIEQLSVCLRQHGPIAIGMRSFTQLPDDIQQCKMVTVHSGCTQETRNVYHADDYLSTSESHYVLLIGIESSKNRVFFIDPNYPTFLLSLSFNFFKNNLSTGEYAYMPNSTLSPSPVKFFEMKEATRANKLVTYLK